MPKFTIELDTADEVGYYEILYWLVDSASPYLKSRSFLTFLNENMAEMPDENQLIGHWSEAYEIMDDHIRRGFAEMNEKWPPLDKPA